MAQRTENEETTELKVVPESTITLCVNCGVAGNSTTNCQTCFSSSVSAPATSSSSSSFISTSSSRRSPSRTLPEITGLNKQELPPPAVVKREVNRCTGCRKKVGLTGFRCRCGELFCADHRYSDRHDCSYDYKSAGREAIARENPVVKAAKIVKI